MEISITLALDGHDLGQNSGKIKRILLFFTVMKILRYSTLMNRLSVLSMSWMFAIYFSTLTFLFTVVVNSLSPLLKSGACFIYDSYVEFDTIKYSQTWSNDLFQIATTIFRSHFELLFHKWPPNNGHLSTVATFWASEGWSLYTGLTVVAKHGFKNDLFLFVN